MPYMSSSELVAFGANAGSISEITHREATRDRSVTLDRFDKTVLFSRYRDGSFARKGGALPNGNPDHHGFLVNPHNGLTSAKPRDVYVVHPKGSGNELRLYGASAGLDFRPGDYFYIFARKGEARPFIGTISRNQLASLLARPMSDLSMAAQGAIVDDEEEDAAYQQAIGNTAAKLPVGFTGQRYPRDPKVALVALESAGFACEAAPVDTVHETFRAAATQRPFVEAHHLVPLARQGEFEANLDIPENIVSLCPTCHRRLHHASPEDRIHLLLKLLTERRQQLAARQVDVSDGELLAAYGIDSAAILNCFKPS